ncbi:hypothetical protein Barb6_03574 [Bacteroidales bacterium Barb6]|nr:hypothetical protein Barb6_03574 [Bacteroidales bacterium Barb6]
MGIVNIFDYLHYLFCNVYRDDLGLGQDNVDNPQKLMRLVLQFKFYIFSELSKILNEMYYKDCIGKPFQIVDQLQLPNSPLDPLAGQTEKGLLDYIDAENWKNQNHRENYYA